MNGIFLMPCGEYKAWYIINNCETCRKQIAFMAEIANVY